MQTAFDKLHKDLGGLASAEEFFNYFSVAYQAAVVHVNRLHILKRFQQYLRTTPGLEKLDEAALRVSCRALLGRAYEDFVRSTPAREKVFKVFQDMDGGHIAIDSLRCTLPSRREGT